MRTILMAAGAALFCFAAVPATAADLPVPRHQASMPAKTQPAQRVGCLRWVEQNRAWYNYCDSVPFYGRHQNHWFPGPF